MNKEETLGEFLRTKRDEKNMGIAEVVNELEVDMSPGYLDALEKDEQNNLFFLPYNNHAHKTLYHNSKNLNPQTHLNELNQNMHPIHINLHV